LGEAAVVDAVVVVGAEEVVEVAPQAGEADVEIAGEGWPPALLEDGAVWPLDVAVGLGAAGAGVGVARLEGVGDELVEVGLELVAVVAEDALEGPAGGGEL
jgi:hypothetical protein